MLRVVELSSREWYRLDPFFAPSLISRLSCFILSHVHREIRAGPSHVRTTIIVAVAATRVGGQAMESTTVILLSSLVVPATSPFAFICRLQLATMNHLGVRRFDQVAGTVARAIHVVAKAADS